MKDTNLSIARMLLGLMKAFAPEGTNDALDDGVEKASDGSLPRFFISLGLSEGIAVPEDNGQWHRLPDIRLLERNVRKHGGEFSLRRAEDDKHLVYEVSRTIKLVLRGIRWDPLRAQYRIRVTWVDCLGSALREELAIDEIRERIGGIPGEKWRLFRYWFTRNG